MSILLRASPVAILSLAMLACPDQWLNDIFRQFMGTENILNQAEIDLSANSENWQRILQTTIDDLKAKDTEVANELNLLVQRGIANAGLTVQCDISYLGDMLIFGIERIKAKLSGTEPQPFRAFVCNASPPDVDMNLDPNRRNAIEVYGYNLDQGNLRLYHVTDSRQEDRTGDFATVSPFKRTINLGLNGIHLDAHSQRLRIDLGDGVYRDIAVIQAYPKVCETKDITLTTQKMTVFPIKFGSGDNDFDGNGPCVRVLVRINAVSRTQIGARATMESWECHGDMTKISYDYTLARGQLDKTLYTTDSEWELAEIRSPTSAAFEQYCEGKRPITRADTGLVANWIVVGDSNGDDIGNGPAKTNVEITFNKLLVVVRRSSDCVTEEELAQMLSQDKMSEKVKLDLQNSHPRVFEKADLFKRVGKRPRPF